MKPQTDGQKIAKSQKRLPFALGASPFSCIKATFSSRLCSSIWTNRIQSSMAQVHRAVFRMRTIPPSLQSSFAASATSPTRVHKVVRIGNDLFGLPHTTASAAITRFLASCDGIIDAQLRSAAAV